MHDATDGNGCGCNGSTADKCAHPSRFTENVERYGMPATEKEKAQRKYLCRCDCHSGDSQGAE